MESMGNVKSTHCTIKHWDPGNIDHPHNGLILRESLFYSKVNWVSSWREEGRGGGRGTLINNMFLVCRLRFYYWGCAGVVGTHELKCGRGWENNFDTRCIHRVVIRIEYITCQYIILYIIHQTGWFKVKAKYKYVEVVGVGGRGQSRQLMHFLITVMGILIVVGRTLVSTNQHYQAKTYRAGPAAITVINRMPNNPPR